MSHVNADLSTKISHRQVFPVFEISISYLIVSLAFNLFLSPA